MIETCGCSDISDVNMNILRGIMTDQILTEHNHSVRKEKYFECIDSFLNEITELIKAVHFNFIYMEQNFFH